MPEVLTRAVFASTPTISERNTPLRATSCTGAGRNRAPSTDGFSPLERAAMIEKPVETYAAVSDSREAVNYDEMTNAFVESLEPLLQLANLAYAYSSQTEHVSACRRRALERVGMRATDLLTELATFVKNET